MSAETRDRAGIAVAGARPRGGARPSCGHLGSSCPMIRSRTDRVLAGNEELRRRALDAGGVICLEPSFRR